MLPVGASARTVVDRMTVYTWLTVAMSLVLWPLAHTSVVYVVVAAILGAVFLREVSLLGRQVDSGRPLNGMRVFHASTIYLSVLFLTVAADVLLRQWW